MTDEQIDDGPLHDYAAAKLAEQYKHGDWIADEILLSLSGLSHYREGDEHEEVITTRAKILEREKEFTLKFLAFTSGLSDAMLERYLMRLVRDKRGYRILPPAEQTQFVMGQYMKDRRRMERKAMRGLVHVDHEQLSPEQRRENEDAKARLMQLRLVDSRRADSPMPTLPATATG